MNLLRNLAFRRGRHCLSTMLRRAWWVPLFLVFLPSCSQSPIFTMISNEVKPNEPLINGSPSKLVSSGGAIYTANGKLWRYSNGWSQV
ncbi:MAG: hypothetical protein LBH18_05660, partial [Spirochaetaceae bacterium]|nr:hypothetical protein [Spirochaetaceae bacterium]